MTFDSTFNYNQILFQLCKARAKLARQRGKSHLNHIISSDKRLNYHFNNHKTTLHKNPDIELLCRMMPPRRKWISPTKKERYTKGGIQRINSLDFNVKSIWKTIDFYKKKHPSSDFLIVLDQFIKSILEDVRNPDYIIASPEITAALKKPLNRNDRTCRPICIYNLKDKIIISLVNKYLTKVFDPLFYDHAYAFRSNSRHNGGPPSHHDAITHLLAYKSNYRGKRLWVAECDISKFFDTVSHKIVKSNFSALVKELEKKESLHVDRRAINIFNKYLKSFDFQKHVLKKNGDKKYWQNQRIVGGYFGWVKEDLEEQGIYRRIYSNKIGIPQGGALSGLIANIVLHHADKKILKEKDDRLCYVRFCDDMIIVHPNKAKATYYSDLYMASLRDLKLIAHLPEKIVYNDKKSFWNNSKSKAPYRWSRDGNTSMPRIGFVGYEICYEGTLRVRMSSLIKEKLKIKNLVNTTLRNLKKGKRKSDEMIIESLINKLIGMAVGRVTMKNYLEIESDMCWVSGFLCLKPNDTLKLQLKRLDRHRAKYISKFKRKLTKIPFKEQVNQKHKYIGKYFFNVIAQINNNDSLNIRKELVDSGILSKRFFLSNRKREGLKNGTFGLVLSAKYIDFHSLIKERLVEELADERDVPIYGKPFSYYYNVIEKGV